MVISLDSQRDANLRQRFICGFCASTKLASVQDPPIETMLEQLKESHDLIMQLRSEITELRNAAPAAAGGDAPVLAGGDVQKMLDDAIKPYKETVAHQQKALEFLEGRNREKNLIVTGLKESVGANSVEQDRNKVDAMLATIGCPGIAPAKVSRLGKRVAVDANNQNARPPRPIMISLDTAADTRSVLDKCKELASNDEYKTVYVKRDSHPLVRKEWKRLRDLVKIEKEAPMNVGTEIKLDYRERAIKRDGVVIHRFVSPFSQ